jgi:hypothetical protein
MCASVSNYPGNHGLAAAAPERGRGSINEDPPQTLHSSV